MQKENATREKVRCILAYSHILLREGLRRLLQDESDLEVVAEAGNIPETLQGVSDYQPQVVIADAQTLGVEATELERRIGQASPSTRVVFLNLNDEQVFQQPARAGAEHTSRPGAVTQTSAQQLVKMVRNAASEGGSSLSPALSEMPRPARNSAQGPMPRNQVLTTREREVLKLLAEGRTVRSAASVLGVSAKTVDAHKFNLMRKLGLHNKVDLVMSAIQMGVLKSPANF